MQLCNKGSYSSDFGTSVCNLCDPGFYCPSFGGTRQLKCAVGTFSGIGQASCEDCPKGYSCSNPAELPAKCPIGFYSFEGSITKA